MWGMQVCVASQKFPFFHYDVREGAGRKRASLLPSVMNMLGEARPGNTKAEKKKMTIVQGSGIFVRQAKSTMRS